MKSYLTILPVAALIAIGCSGGDTIVSSSDTREQIRVVGTASVEAIPDMAEVQLGVQTFADSVDQAVAENNRITEAVLAALKATGIAEGDLRTTAFNIAPQRDYKREEPEQIIGYRVNNTVTATIRAVGNTGMVLQAAVDAGANRSFGLLFGLQDPTPVEQQARMLAVEDARRRAQDLAAAAGVTLGKLLAINEASFGGGPVFARAEFDQQQSAAVPVEPGELQIAARVEVAYKIVE